MSLKQKFTGMVVISSFGVVCLAGFLLKIERSELLSERMQKSRSLVDLPYSIIMAYHQQEVDGKLGHAEAQQQALAAIRSLRYEDSNYFFIIDTHPNMVMHPVKPELDGKDLTDVKDANGKALFVAMVDAAKATAGDFVYYLWPKPGSERAVRKLSFVKPFEPWGWIVGTGIYIDDVDAAWRSHAVLAAGLTLGCLGFLLISSRTVARCIFVRLEEMIERSKDIAEGDLSKRLAITSCDEVARLARWFNTFADKLQDALRQVARSTHSLVEASGEVARNAQEQARGSELQQDQTNQVVTAMQEMASTVQQVSESANRAAAASQKAAETARQGGKVVEATLSRMRAIADSVGQTAGKIQELGKRSDDIGRIIRVIDDIADQTNLLALNAAIEAARAGEQGRGFAVVADEVRKLAERTSGATKEITQMITDIQAETANAVTAMQAGTREVELGVESTSEAGCSLHDIIEMSEQVGDMVTHIATATTEQSAATEEINSNVDKIAKITAASAASAHQTSGTLQDLSLLASNLQCLIKQFRLGDGNDGADDGSGRRRLTENASSPCVSPSPR